MTDIHCHILPGIDDGAPDPADALEMARLAAASGVTAIVATPHFPGEPRSLGMLPDILDRYKRLFQAIRQAGIHLTLYPGAEILCTPETIAMARNHQLPTLGNTSYLLCEFYFDTPFSQMDRILTEIAACGYTPVIAHPERYEAIIHDPRGVGEWFGRGWVIQLNKGSVLGAFGYQVQQTAEWLLTGGLVHIVASDAHSSYRRTTDMAPVYQKLMQRHPPAYVRLLLEENPRRLIAGADMAPA